ncbi:hypothetical protein [Vitiosangium sp. GDMCC 1.1324]|uniref:hypothetical protein n=1 Tax=Vitiosangium sp. (strain GDMCC 1.1324) TaxID=2138576 RepID=UPI000D3C1CDD|nr:hypothetical protein [Vitiosangium sp. GDMCC 1.1324]PTL83199.1 hypothetical protein DAT35_14470 [Vitiosangium sp. GDMCC 1.1324]
MRSLLLAILALAVALPARAQTTGGDSLLPTAPTRALPDSELHVDLGALTGGYTHGDGAWMEPFASQAASGHLLLGGLTLDGGVLSLVPLQRGGAGASLTLTARVGYTGERWSLIGGPVFGIAWSAQPALQVLPSLKALYRVGPVDLHAGVLDVHGLVPAHVGASWKGLGLAYVLPLGARAWANIPLTSSLGLRVEGFAFRLGIAQSAMLTVGLTARPSPGTRP